MDMVIRINLENAAFFPPRPEICRILRDIADKIEEAKEDPSKLMDVNGNTCGSVRFVK